MPIVSPSRLLATGLATCLLGACSSSPLPRQVPTAERAGQSWVVTRPQVAAELSRACPGGLDARIDDFWAPSRSDIDRLESDLPTLGARLPDAVTGDRQYVGVVIGGQRHIYVRGFPAIDNTGHDPTRSVVVDCAVGWHALYDPGSGQFTLSTPPALDR